MLTDKLLPFKSKVEKLYFGIILDICGNKKNSILSFHLPFSLVCQILLVFLEHLRICYRHDADAVVSFNTSLCISLKEVDTLLPKELVIRLSQ